MVGSVSDMALFLGGKPFFAAFLPVMSTAQQNDSAGNVLSNLLLAIR